MDKFNHQPAELRKSKDQSPTSPHHREFTRSYSASDINIRGTDLQVALNKLAGKYGNSGIGGSRDVSPATPDQQEIQMQQKRREVLKKRLDKEIEQLRASTHGKTPQELWEIHDRWLDMLPDSLSEEDVAKYINQIIDIEIKHMVENIADRPPAEQVQLREEWFGHRYPIDSPDEIHTDEFKNATETGLNKEFTEVTKITRHMTSTEHQWQKQWDIHDRWSKTLPDDYKLEYGLQLLNIEATRIAESISRRSPKEQLQLRQKWTARTIPKDLHIYDQDIQDEFSHAIKTVLNSELTHLTEYTKNMDLPQQWEEDEQWFNSLDDLPDGFLTEKDDNNYFIQMVGIEANRMVERMQPDKLPAQQRDLRQQWIAFKTSETFQGKQDGLTNDLKALLDRAEAKLKEPVHGMSLRSSFENKNKRRRRVGWVDEDLGEKVEQVRVFKEETGQDESGQEPAPRNVVARRLSSRAHHL